MDDAHRFDALRIEGEAAVRTAEDRLDAAIPHLDWSVGELIGHLGGVHFRFARCLRGEVDAWPHRDSVDVPDDGLAAWARSALADVVSALGSVDLDEQFTTWAGSRDGHFVLRRLANETAVHRWDAQAASGPPDAIGADHAIEIVDEFLTDIVGDRGLPGVSDHAARDGTTLHLHATDTDGEWFVTVRGEGIDVDRRHDKGDVALRGSAGDLALWLNGRLPPSRLDAFGPADLVTWWSAAFQFD